MIPISLKLSGFLSYKDPVELDFSSFHLACISGSNGAGKSSILDAITWSLFGMARKRDDSVIHTHPDVNMAEVVFTFKYEQQIYRVIRTLPIGKGTNLEFQIQAEKGDENELVWRSISEHSVRETQNRIKDVLGLDYETFVNAAFFLQGKADQFAQQPSAKRKEILGNILGLETWEEFRKKTYDLRKAVETDLASKDGQIQEIDLELSEESERKKKLKELEETLDQISTSRKALELNLEQMKRLSASLAQQRKLVGTLKESLDRIILAGNDLSDRKKSRQNELDKNLSLIKRASEIEKSYNQWQEQQKKLDELEILGKKYREIEAKMVPLTNKIDNEKSRLENELIALKEEEEKITMIKDKMPALNNEVLEVEISLSQIETKLLEKERLNNEILSTREYLGELRSNIENLKMISLEFKERSANLAEAKGVICPLCGQPLEPDDRERLIKQLDEQVADNRLVYKQTSADLEETTSKINSLELEMGEIRKLETERLAKSNQLTKLKENHLTQERSIQDWGKKEKHFSELSHKFKHESFLVEEREILKKYLSQLKEIGYDAVIHDEISKREFDLRESQKEYLELEIARGSVKPVEDELKNLEKQIADNRIEVENQQMKYREALKILETAENTHPDVDSTESELNSIREQENQLISAIGGAKQRVSVLDDLRIRKRSLIGERKELAQQIGRLKTLERAFSKDGVPALLIEQALPEIENRANDLLERLSDGTMSISFLTQSEYKDKKRQDMKETLDIQIRDGSGVRDYEMFSGGEAFRVNFAIRLALSEVLSHRKGARLQTLVIDEGFGSQDGHGRQRLIESINAIKEDFAKVLIITHLDELKDAFETRIEVSKTENGSVINVI